MTAESIGERKFKPAGKNATPKICGAQIVKGIKKELEALRATQHKNDMPLEIAGGMRIQLFNGGYQQER